MTGNLISDGEFGFRAEFDWAKLPEGWKFLDASDVAVDSRDRVYVFNRGGHPMTVFDRDGNLVDSWGEGLFSRPHGLTIGPDDMLYCADDGDHTVRKCSPDGKVLMTLGVPNKPAEYLSNRPFNRPTKVALEPETGALYIADGYGNARVHKYSADGQLLFSWGDFGTGQGEFNLVHSICTDRDGRVYVADRENHRIQIFDEKGKFITQWNDMHRPCALHITEGSEQLVLIGQLPTSLKVNENYPRIGACISVHDTRGRQLARFGADYAGDEAPDQVYAPHGITMDSRGDIYMGEVSHTFFGSVQVPPQEVRCFRKLKKINI